MHIYVPFVLVMQVLSGCYTFAVGVLKQFAKSSGVDVAVRLQNWSYPSVWSLIAEADAKSVTERVLIIASVFCEIYL